MQYLYRIRTMITSFILNDTTDGMLKHYSQGEFTMEQNPFHSDTSSRSITKINLRRINHPQSRIFLILRQKSKKRSKNPIFRGESDKLYVRVFLISNCTFSP